jgi:hypothetical protein
MTTIFSDGQAGSAMETAHNFSAWTSVAGGSETIESTLYHSGSYAMQCTNFGRATYTLSPSQATAYARFYVNFSSLPASGNLVSIGEFLGSFASNDLIVVGVKNDSGTIKWGCTYPEATFTASPNPTTGLWYCVEFYSIKGTGRKIYVDGSEVWSGTDTQGINVDTFMLGRWDNGTETCTTTLDDIVVADAYIGLINNATVTFNKHWLW